MVDLAERSCVPCTAQTPRLTPAEIDSFLAQTPGWEVVDGHHLTREFRFADFAAALAAINRIGAVAEAENHHPDLELGWGRCRVTLWTHAIDGLSENDFVLAAKCDRAVTGDAA